MHNKYQNQIKNTKMQTYAESLINTAGKKEYITAEILKNPIII